MNTTVKHTVPNTQLLSLLQKRNIYPLPAGNQFHNPSRLGIKCKLSISFTSCLAPLDLKINELKSYLQTSTQYPMVIQGQDNNSRTIVTEFLVKAYGLFSNITLLKLRRLFPYLSQLHMYHHF